MPFEVLPDITPPTAELIDFVGPAYGDDTLVLWVLYIDNKALVWKNRFGVEHDADVIQLLIS